MKNIARFLVILMLLMQAAFTDVHAYADGDFQIWHNEVQEFNVSKKIKVPLEEEFRYGDNASELYYHHYDIGLTYDANKNLTIGVFYRQIYEGEKGKSKPEFQPHFDITPKVDIYGFHLEDRNRFEYKLYDDNRADIVEYRNKISIRSPWKLTPLKIQPYVADEVFVWLNTAFFRRNRFDAGASFEFAKNLKGDVYYRLQCTKKSGRWTDANILGLKLKVSF